MATVLRDCSRTFRTAHHAPTERCPTHHTSTQHVWPHVIVLGSSQQRIYRPTRRPVRASSGIPSARSLPWYPGPGACVVSTSSARCHSWPETCAAHAPDVVHQSTERRNRERTAASASTSRRPTPPRTAALTCDQSVVRRLVRDNSPRQHMSTRRDVRPDRASSAWSASDTLDRDCRDHGLAWSAPGNRVRGAAAFSCGAASMRPHWCGCF